MTKLQELPSAAPPVDDVAFANEFSRNGYFISESGINGEEVNHILQVIQAIPQGDEVRRRRGVYGVRNLPEICSAVRELARKPRIRRFVTPVLGDHAFAVRAIYFDKSPHANWSLFWHQDNVVSAAERREAPGFVGWSRKAGVWQVQPPAEVLAKMVAVRVHLDDSKADNGPLRVIPGSHRHGWIEDVDQWKHREPEVVCTVGRGGVVVMCPLTLHASAASASKAHRRVIHIEYAADELPQGLAWNNRVAEDLNDCGA